VGGREILETYLNSASKNTSETDIFPHGTKSLLTSVFGVTICKTPESCTYTVALFCSHQPKGRVCHKINVICLHSFVHRFQNIAVLLTFFLSNVVENYVSDFMSVAYQ
jgi:hypothetical protein